MNNQNNYNNSFNDSFSNSRKTPPKDLLTLSSSTPKKASISNNASSNNKFIVSNQELNSINTSLGSNSKFNNNNTITNNTNINNTETQSTNKFITNDGLNNGNNNQPKVISNNSNNNVNSNNNNLNNINTNQQVDTTGNKFITNDTSSSVKNINIGSKSIFNVSNNQNMTLNSNNNTYPNYNNSVNTKNGNNVNNNQNVQMSNNSINTEKQKQKTDKLMKKTFVPLVELEHKTKKQNKLFFGILSGSVVVFVIVISIALFASGKKISFFGGSPYYTNIVHNKTSDDETYVAVENKWENVSITTKEEAHELIRQDSENQKQRCRDELGIKYEKVEQIEKKLEKEYNIIAVNFCEMDADYLINLEKEIKKVYQEFPVLKNYMTNLSIANSSYMGDENIAQFNHATDFATPKSILSGKSAVVKTRIYLNASYFLDLDSLKQTVKGKVEMGDYIPNADIYSIVIHEFGHYLSFIAALKNNNKIDTVLLN